MTLSAIRARLNSLSWLKRTEIFNVSPCAWKILEDVGKLLDIAKAAEIACDDTDLQCEDGHGKLDALRDCLVALGSSESLPDPSKPPEAP